MEQPSMAHEITGESERVGEHHEHWRTLFVLFAMFATAYPSGLIPRTVRRTGTDGVSRQGRTGPTQGE